MAFENLEPKEVFHFFEEICNIPHGSGNLQKISDFLVKFAKDRGLEVIQDKELNVIIKAPGSEGYEDKEPVILQGHMDMVAVKDEGTDIDMLKDGLKVTTDGEYVWAEGTSLGGDDGIAVAYCLALLDSKDIPHPPLEVVITTNEEVGMDGARVIDLSSLKGKRMINIDNEEEGIFITSCAGGARVYSKVPVEREKATGLKLQVSIAGLIGGHSGEMIIKGRGNANILLARALLEAFDNVDIMVNSIEGGVADNAIPSGARAEVLVEKEDIDKFTDSLKKTRSALRGELEGKDADVTILLDGFELSDEKLSAHLSAASEVEEMVLSDKAGFDILSLICSMPDGVQAMSASVEGLVETSLNLGILKTTDTEITLEQSVRSSVESSKDYLIRKIATIAACYNAEISVSGVYPGWKYRTSSQLREHMVEVYEKMYGKKPVLKAIHAGLECGILSDKIENLDCISIGPDMQDIHSTKEKLSVRSAANVWEYLKEVLK